MMSRRQGQDLLYPLGSCLGCILPKQSQTEGS